MTDTSKKAEEKDNAEESPQPPQSEFHYINFDNGNKATVLHVGRHDNPIDIVKKMGLEKPQALIMNIGGAGGLDGRLNDRLVQLYSRAIAKAAVEMDALIIDGGTESGVMQMMGHGVADRGSVSRLIGISPRSKVTYPGGSDMNDDPEISPLEPNHTHFVLVDGEEWGCETKTMWGVARTLANEEFEVASEPEPEPEPVAEPAKSSSKLELLKKIGQKTSAPIPSSGGSQSSSNLSKGYVPAVTVLVNGGAIATHEVLNSVRLGWPVIIIEGSGRLADRIIELIPKNPNDIDDPALAEILSDGKLFPYPIDGPVDGPVRFQRQPARA